MEAIRKAIDAHWKRVFHFAFRMTLDRSRATEVVEETYLRAYVGSERMPPVDSMEAWLLRIANHVIEKMTAREPEVNFDVLDETLRSEATRTDCVKSLTDPQRNFLLWELKQGCMTSVVNCLPHGERVAFTMAVILDYTEEDAAKVLGITTSAFKVRLSRARKKVSDYLAPRCEHVDPRNPCHCPSRLGVAINRGFLPVVNAQVNLRPQFGRYGSTVDGEDAPLRDVMAIYQSLPDPDPPGDLGKQLLAKLDSGAWEAMRTRVSQAPR